MPSLSKYTQWKVIGGYSLLFLLSILAAVLIYKQIIELIVSEENSDNPNRKLFIIGNTITGLYESEGLGNAFVQTGSRSYFLKYRDLIEEVESNIDSLRDLTTRLDQILRLDTINDLLDQKIRNLQDIVRVKQSFVPDDFYNKAIASIESGRDSLQGTDIRKRHITTLDSSYTKSEKKKRRWLFFSKTEPDSVLKVSVSHHTVIDTLNRQTALQNTDSVVHILKTAWEDVQKQTQDITRQINRKEYALIQQSTYITDQLKRILGAYEKEEITNSLIKQETREQTLNTMIRIFAWLAVIAFLLILFFTFFILRDLSRSQRYRKELEAANRYADQLLKSREKMILTVTHDIKSPLSSVIGYIELLNNTPINERQRYFLKNMRGSSEHILKLIGNLLDLSKLENNKMPVEHIVFNPYHLFQEITDNFMPLAAAKHLELKARFSEDLDKDYSGDALRIRQILTNILSNAVKYTTTGYISFSAETVNPEKIRLKIQDTGSGMTPEEQKIIFQEFTRLTSHATIEGTGLGLTITLKLIHLLGGEIQLNSTPGKGSCFTILLPLGQCTTSSSTASPETPIPPRPGIPVSGSPKILFIDDDPLQLEMAVGLLANYGIQAEATTSPQHLLNKLASTKYDLLFSDIQMPETNGFDLVKQIRNSSLPNAADLCIVALSADSGRTEKEYLDAGFSAFLSKPFTSGQLTALITHLTGISLSGPATTSSSNPAQDIERRGYSLKHILQFVDNDREALQKILDSFVLTTREHIELLKKYQEEKQCTAIVQLAHKMLPMFRQLEIDEEIPLLEKLEQATKNDLPENQILSLTQEVINKTILLLKEDFKIS